MVTLSAITMPVILGSAPDGAQIARQWRHLYRLGHSSAPPIAIGTFALYTYSALTSRAEGRPWQLIAAAGVATLSIIPFTLVAMMPTNHALEGLEVKGAAGKQVDLEEARGLAKRWTWLHLVRSMFPLAGALIGVASTCA